MKRILFALLLSACMLMTGCGNKKSEERKEAEIPKAWTDCATMEDAYNLAGFEFYVPQQLDEYPNVLIQAGKNSMIQVFFSDKELGTEGCNSILFRKGIGHGDITGDYNEYSQKSLSKVAGQAVTERGNNGLVYNAFWNDGDYSYAIVVSNGMTDGEIEAFIELVK